MSWLQDWQQQIYRNFLSDDALSLILSGFQNTLVIFIFGSIWALVLATFLTYLNINNKLQWLYRPLQCFVATIHDVPAVVLMMFFYYVIFSGLLNGVVVSIIALGVYSSGSLSRIFKIHIGQVGKEQYESGKMLGFTSKQIYRLIILPQAVRNMLPLVIGEMKVLLRATSYAGYIFQKDLVKAVDSIRAHTEDVFLPLLFVSLLYLFLSSAIVKIFKMLNAKFFCHD
ncbi:MAG: ABC transporter permease subunit [Bacteroides sp.]|nr:ABC transporter permease subunit [Bacteroides sp.]